MKKLYIRQFWGRALVTLRQKDEERIRKFSFLAGNYF